MFFFHPKNIVVWIDFKSNQHGLEILNAKRFLKCCENVLAECLYEMLR